MDQAFLDEIFTKHNLVAQQTIDTLIQMWVNSMINILFPTVANSYNSHQLESTLLKEQQKLANIIKNCKTLPQYQIDISKQASQSIFKNLPQIYKKLKLDLYAKFQSKNISNNNSFIIKSYPTFINIIVYRFAHEIYKLGYKQIAQIITHPYNVKNKIYINSGAKIGEGFVLQDGCNIEIGETAEIGKNVKIYNNVTIGSLGQKIDQKCLKIHPTIQDNVIIYQNAKILGGKTIIGHGSIIGNNVCLTESVLPNSKIFNKPQIQVIINKDDYSIQNLIGNSPLVQIKRLIKNPNIKIYAKLQGQNPGGSVKDRPAYNMIKQALKRGDIKPGMKLIQPTSGNTGIALAMIACMFDLQIQLVMPQNSTAQRVQTMQAYGAKVILTSAKGGIQGSRDYAQQQVKKGGYVMLNQFGNSDNYMAHYYSTGPQIWKDTKGQVTHFVSSMGTTGTIMGTSMYLKQKNNNIQIVGVQPTQGSKIPGIRRWTPQYLPKIFNKQRVDQIIDVSQEESLIMMRRMAKEQAIFAGMSSGGAMAAAIKLANTIQKGVIVTIVCDRGDRYLSSGIFANQEKLQKQKTC